MKYTFLIIAIFVSIGFQNPNSYKSEIENLYLEALNQRFDLMLSSGYKYIELNEVTSEVKNRIPSNSIFKFLTNEELIRVAIKKKRDLKIYRMTHKEISKDTLDINFSHLSLTAKRKIHWNKGLKFIKAEYKLSCGGTNGYEPDFRFVKDVESNTWKMIKNKFIMKEK